MRERREVARERDLTNGPGKLCEALAHHRRAERAAAARERDRDSARRGDPDDSHVVVTPRIGITKSAEWPLRWYVEGSPYVSKTPKHLRPR